MKDDGIEFRGALYKESGAPFTEDEVGEIAYAFIAWVEARGLYYGGGFALVDCDVVEDA